MIKWKLHVSGFGKIKKAELEYAPLILFVGDNNSGKSYLLSLLWGMYTSAGSVLFDFTKLSKNIIGKQVIIWLDEMINKLDENKVKMEFNIDGKKELIEKSLNSLCKENKQIFVESIFNSDKVKIDDMYITLSSFSRNNIIIEYESDLLVKIKYGKGTVLFPKEMMGTEDRGFIRRIFWELIVSNILGSESFRSGIRESNVFLPAARTGFMLTKDTINKVGRKHTFDWDIIEKDEINIQPFTKPIIQFLDVMEDLSYEMEDRSKYKKIINFIEENIVNGTINMPNDSKKEVKYSPNGSSESIPLRVSSAVVSEISPLVLILKYKRNISKLFYEEPEMCLHPKLQKLLSRIICMMVNAKIPVIATTHSDILVQHINNMIKLNSMDSERRKALLDEFEYSESEVIDSKDVKIYQFKNMKKYTEVIELECKEYGFEIPTFNDALDKFMNEIIRIQE